MDPASARKVGAGQQRPIGRIAQQELDQTPSSLSQVSLGGCKPVQKFLGRAGLQLVLSHSILSSANMPECNRRCKTAGFLHKFENSLEQVSVLSGPEGKGFQRIPAAA
jgi:hypothetical protein